MRLTRPILDARIADAAAINPGKMADAKTFATVEELFIVSQPANLAPGTGVSLELMIGVIPIAARLESLMFAATGATPSNTGTNSWRFTPRRKRGVYTGTTSTRSIASTDIGGVQYSKPWLALEGCTIDSNSWVAAYSATNGAYFAPRDVLAVNISSVGTPAEGIVGMIFTARLVPL